jgi:hypothetical protein
MNMRTNAEFSAFPIPDAGGWKGLTKREMFAAMAMQGFASSDDPAAAGTLEAVLSVRWADALLAELARRAAASEGVRRDG